jgi:hypothetical protein
MVIPLVMAEECRADVGFQRGVGAQNDQSVQEALECENAFELFMRIMNAHSARALLAVLVRHVRTSLGAH